MKAVRFALFAVALSFGAHAELPPLIDRDALFGEIQIANAQISPDGRYLSFLKPYQGVRNLWVKQTNERFSAAKPVSAETHRPIPAYFWSRDGKYLLYVQDQGGDENFNVYAVDPAATPAQGQQVPPARNLTAATGARAEIYDLPKNDPDTMFVGLNDRDKAWHDLYRLRISSGERTLLRQNTERIASWVFDHKGELRLAVRTTPAGDTEILRVERDAFTRIYSCDITEECAPVGFDPDNRYVSTEPGVQK